MFSRQDHSVVNLFNIQISFVFIFLFRPEFNFTSQYLVRVDDFFLHYLQKVRNLFTRYFAFAFACRFNFFNNFFTGCLTNHSEDIFFSDTIPRASRLVHVFPRLPWSPWFPTLAAGCMLHALSMTGHVFLLWVQINDYFDHWTPGLFQMFINEVFFVTGVHVNRDPSSIWYWLQDCSSLSTEV